MAPRAHDLVLRDLRARAATCAGYRPFDPAYRVLFNSYYNAVGEKHPRPERGMLSRPGLDEVLAYRRHVDQAHAPAARRNAASRPALAELIELGSHHEQQHQELILTDLKHLLSRNPLRPAYQKPWPLTPIRARVRGWISYRGRTAGNRARRRRLLLRQRDAAAPRLAGALQHRHASGHARRFHRIHRGRRLPQARTLAVRRVGHGQRARLAGACVLGAP